MPDINLATLHSRFNHLIDDVVALGRQARRVAELQLAFISGMVFAALVAISILGLAK